VGAWLTAFAFTQAFEVPLYLRASDGSWRTAFLASALTHPVVWFLFPLLMDHGVAYWPMVGAAEAFAVLAEAAWLQANGVHRALLWSLLANGVSCAGGFLLRAVFGVP
jgi:hypothetical protein